VAQRYGLSGRCAAGITLMACALLRADALLREDCASCGLAPQLGATLADCRAEAA
jgi:hypothetical protein